MIHHDGQDVYSEDVVDSMAGYNANVVTLTMGSELSGQIASYSEAAVSDPEGNVVAGAIILLPMPPETWLLVPKWLL
jgi:hypothetical protein